MARNQPFTSASCFEPATKIIVGAVSADPVAGAIDL